MESLEASVEYASKLFQNARVEYLEVLLAQRDLMDARTVLIETKREQLSAIVNTYQALGGGAGLPCACAVADANLPPWAWHPPGGPGATNPSLDGGVPPATPAKPSQPAPAPAPAELPPPRVLPPPEPKPGPGALKPMDKDGLELLPPLPVPPPAPKPGPAALGPMDKDVFELPPPLPLLPPAPKPGTSTLGATGNEGLELPPPISNAGKILPPAAGQ